MLKTIICSLLLIIPFCTCDCVYDAPSVLNDTELLMTFMIHRHGDRTPTSGSITYATDYDAVLAYVNKYGYGQLTETGIRRGYQLGQFIRSRYDELLSSRFNTSEIYIRSTDSTRAKMTVTAAMSAVYPATENWCDGLEGCDENVGKWTPVPYTTVNATTDFNLAAVNCPTYISGYYAAFLSTNDEMTPYNDVLEQLSEYIGTNLTAYPCLVYAIHDVYASQISLGVPLPDELEAIYPEIEEAAGAAIDVLLNNEDYLYLGSGVLLKRFFDIAAEIIAGDDVAPVQVYSAHDINVYSFMSITEATPLPGVPKYGAVYALELRQVVSTGENIVVPIYVSDPATGEFCYLQVDGCGEVCELAAFEELVSANELEETEYLTKCDWTPDYAFDLSSIA